MSGLRIAVVGATGVVGETIVRVLGERDLPIERLQLFAARGRDGVQAASEEALLSHDVVFFAGSEDASERYAPALLNDGAIVIDNSSTFRMRDGTPLVVPEINADAVHEGNRLFPIANCTAIILCMALAPIKSTAGLARVCVATYQAVSGAGRTALEEFDSGEGPIIGNVIPQIGPMGEKRSSEEEEKVRQETRKILDLPNLPIAVTAVRVPVRTTHCEAVFFETARETPLAVLAAAFDKAAGVVYHENEIVTPRQVEGTDEVHVSRLRQEDARLFQMWVAGDQLRKGAATNGVQILELLLERGALLRR